MAPRKAAGPLGGERAGGDVFSVMGGLGASLTGILVVGVGGGGVERIVVSSSLTRIDGGRGLFLLETDLLVLVEDMADSRGGGERR